MYERSEREHIRKLKVVVNLIVDSFRMLDEALDHVFLTLEYSLSQLFVFSSSPFSFRPLTITLPVIFVINIFTLIYVSVTCCALPVYGLHYYSLESIWFHSTTFLGILSYYLAVVTDPGRIPRDYHPDKYNTRLSNERKQSSGLFRFCKKEKLFKPDRAHFCSPLDRNVLRMDHYCAWSAGAIGFYNYKYFFTFLLYSNISNLTAIAWNANILVNFQGVLTTGQFFLISQSVILSSTISLVLVPFFFFHCYLITNNLTTIEYCDRRRSKSFITYELGWSRNWTYLLGRNPLYWFLPIQTVEGNGLEFERAGENNILTNSLPPREFTSYISTTVDVYVEFSNKVLKGLLNLFAS